MPFKKALFTSVFALVILLGDPQIISNVDAINTLPAKEMKIGKLSKAQEKIVSNANEIFSMNSELFTSIQKQKRFDSSPPLEKRRGEVPPILYQKVSLFSKMERRDTIEENNFFGLNRYLSRDGFTLNFPINHSLHLATSLSPLNLERSTKLRLNHKNDLAIFNSEVTLGFTGDYSLKFGLTRYF